MILLKIHFTYQVKQFTFLQIQEAIPIQEPHHLLLKHSEKLQIITGKNKIDTIFLLPGNYKITEPLTVDNTLFIKGIKGKSFIVPDTENSENVFIINNSVLILKDLIIQSDNYCCNYLYSENSLAVFDNTVTDAESSRFIKMKNSRLIVEDSDLSLHSVFYSEPFDIESGKISVSGSSFNISSSSGIKAFSMKNSSLSLENSSFLLNSDESLFTESSNSIINNENIRIKIESDIYSDFYNAVKSRISISNCFFSDSSDSEKSAFLKSHNSELQLSYSSINLNSIKKSSFIDAEKGDYNIKSIMLIINADENILPALRSANAVFNVKDCDITLKNSVTGGFISSSDSILEIYSSEIKNISDKRKFLIDLKGSGTAFIKNNIFIPDELIIRKSPDISVIKEQ